MAKVISGSLTDDFLKNTLIRLVQSGNLNFIIGSGASSPAIKVAGNIETEIQELFKTDEPAAHSKIFDFLNSFKTTFELLESQDLTSFPVPPGQQAPPLNKSKEDTRNVQTFYKDFLNIIERILTERKDNIHPKRANIFSTNYDLFIESAAQFTPSLILNDGFDRTPSIKQRYIFSSRSFFNSVYNTGNLFNYKVEVPTVNLMKLHGSLNWKKDGEQIIFGYPIKGTPDSALGEAEKKKAYNSTFSLIIPQKGKFRETIMDRTYYDLLRIYANELDKENTLLVIFGFSFEDEHIKDITVRALKNPTLQALIFAYSETDVPKFEEKFSGYTNVIILKPEGNQKYDFPTFNKCLNSIVDLKNREAK